MNPRLPALLCLLAVPVSSALAETPVSPKVQEALDRVDADVALLRADFDQHVPKGEKAWVQKKLEELSAVDAKLRSDSGIPFKEGWGEADKNAFDDAYWKKYQEAGFANIKELDGLLKRYGWIRAAKFGEKASEDAWQLVLHADQDLAFQKSALERLSKLKKATAKDLARWAELSDRIAVAENRPQSFGTQGGCKGSGKWEPSPIDDKDHLDQRRGQAGLEPFDEYKARKEKLCP